MAMIVTFGVQCGGDKQVTVAEYCAQRAEKECTSSLVAACLSTQDACEADRQAACLVESAALMSAKRPFRPEKIGACTSKAAEVHGKSPITPADRLALAEACGRVFSGSAKMGEACANGDSFECDQGLICDARFGRCAAKTVMASGGYCNNPGDICPDTEYCLLEGGLRTCTPRKTEGQPCDAENLCGPTLRCTSGACAKRAGIREACASDDDCAPTAPYCDPFTLGGVCTTGFIPAPTQAECGEYGADAGGPGGAGGA